MKQTMMVGDSNINFKAPNYSETNVNCPAVESIKIYIKDCTTISAEFSNSNDLMSSLSNGLLYAELVNEQAPQTIEFCIKVSSSLHFTTIYGLEFVLEKNCKTALSPAKTLIAPFEKMYSDSKELTTLLSPA